MVVCFAFQEVSFRGGAAYFLLIGFLQTCCWHCEEASHPLRQPAAFQERRLSMQASMENSALLTEIADKALLNYDIEVVSKQLIRHNENLLWRVTDHIGNNFALRIHMPKHGGFIGFQQRKTFIESELMWLQALRTDTDIEVQEPITNKAKELVSFITDESIQQSIACTLLTWVDGEVFSQDDPAAMELTVKMGALQQTLHAHSQKWVPPAGFRRLIYDETTIVQACDNLGKGIQSGIIGNDDYRIVCDVTKLICSLFANTPKTKASWGLVHADFLSGNLLIREGQLIPIDFSLSGWAYYLLDPAICLCNLKKHLRKAFIEGYGLQLTEERLYFIEALTLYIILVAASRQINNIVWKSWFEKRFPVITGEFCQKLQRHVSFIYDI